MSDPKGVFSAVLTPFKDDLTIDLPAYLDHCRWLMAQGCDGIAALGTTGEANSLSLAERQAVLEALAQAGIVGEKLILGTGACALPDAIALTKRAVALGAPHVLVLPPFYFKNPSEDGLYAYYARLIEAVGDAALRVYLYHIPQTSAVPIPHELIVRLRKDFGATVAGVKDSSFDFENMKAMLELVPGFRVFSGSETLLLPLMEIGGVGCITAGSNIFPAATAEAYRAWREDGTSAVAKAAQAELTAKRKSLDGAPQIPTMKALIAAARKMPGWKNVRPPFTPLGKTASEAALARALLSPGELA
ncbi:MAG TPA: dihydrodipicolinate synthase family protein [Alphaproteobacteria bacterium]|nr:dihydrodipicolinate synthase family protein [Alphaproteobacteria bacterium]